MPHFQTAFQLWADHQKDSLNQWSERCAIQAGVLYRLRAGTKEPTSDIMTRLLPCIAQHDSQVAADRLLIAYLQDHIPAGFENELTIALRSADSVTPDLLEAALTYHAERAAQDTAYAEHLITLYLLSRETDLMQIHELVTKWHTEHPSPPEARPSGHLRITPLPESLSRVAEDPASYNASPEER